MTYTTVPSAGQYGFIADALPQELPPNAWSSIQNVRFRDGYAGQFGGSAQVYATPSVAPYFISSYRALNSKYWIHAGIARVYVDDGTTRTDLTPTTAYTGAVDNRWTGGAASGVFILNNGVDQPQFWGGSVSNPFATLTGWNSAWRCASLRPFKQYIVALDITKSGTRYGSMVKWSAAAVPGALPTSWDETDATKDAGEVDLAETTDLMVDQLQLGDINVIYKEKSMYGMQYIGAPFIWRFYRLPGDVGMLARGCAVNTPKGHVVLTAGDLIVHSGQGPSSLVSARLRKWLFNQIDVTNYARSFLTTNDAMNEVWVCYPQSGQAACTQALVWNWLDDTFSVRDLPNVTCGATGQAVINSTDTWASDSNPWSSDLTTWDNTGFTAAQSRLFMGSTAPLLMVMDGVSASFNGSAPTVKLERTGLAFDTPEVIKTAKAIVPRIDAPAGTVLSFQLGGQMDAEAAVAWSPISNYVVGTTRKVDLFSTGRFLALRITSAANSAWRLKSYDIDIKKQGSY